MSAKNKIKCELCILNNTHSYDQTHWIVSVRLKKGKTKDMVLCEPCARDLEKLSLATNFRKLKEKK